MFFAQELSTHFVGQDVALLLGLTQQIPRIAQTLWFAIKNTFIKESKDILHITILEVTALYKKICTWLDAATCLQKHYSYIYAIAKSWM